MNTQSPKFTSVRYRELANRLAGELSRSPGASLLQITRTEALVFVEACQLAAEREPHPPELDVALQELAKAVEELEGARAECEEVTNAFHSQCDTTVLISLAHDILEAELEVAERRATYEAEFNRQQLNVVERGT